MTGCPWNGYKSRRSRSRNVNKWRWMPSKGSKSFTTRRADANISGDCCKGKGRLFSFRVKRLARREPFREQKSRLQALHKGENQRPPLTIQSHPRSAVGGALARGRHDVTLWERRRLKRNPRDAHFPEPWISPL